MTSILDDDEDTLAPNSGERPAAVLNPRGLAMQAFEDGRIHEFEQESCSRSLCNFNLGGEAERWHSESAWVHYGSLAGR
jgi:hypothetical protein